MILNSLISIPILVSMFGMGKAPPEQKMTSIVAIAKVDGFTKVVDMHTFQLVVIRLAKGYGITFTNAEVSAMWAAGRGPTARCGSRTG